MLVTKISSSIFFTKLVLTIIEGINTWLVYKYSKEKWLALLYWVSPISIWWVSHEGQFEPLQSLFVLGALCMLGKKRSWAFLLLAVAIQVKLTAILFLPYFIFMMKNDDPKQWIRTSLFFVAGFLPTIVAMCYYPVLNQVFSTQNSFAYNPYYWNIFNYSMFNWNPKWMVAIHQLITYGMLIFFAYAIVKWKEIKTFLAPSAFIAFCKASKLAQFWYFIVYAPFLLPIQNKRLRFLLFALTPLFDLTSVIQIFSGPFGYTVGEYYKGMNVFTELVL